MLNLHASSAFKNYIMQGKWTKPLGPHCMPLSAAFTILASGVANLAWRLCLCMMWKVKRLSSGLKKTSKGPKQYELQHKWQTLAGGHEACVHACRALYSCAAAQVLAWRLRMCVDEWVQRKERPIKKLPEERTFSWESMGGQRGLQGHCVSQFHPESWN